ncbi:MAG: hypothetical protein IPF42_09220 [Candidatus Microthrix sp.]|nr:hypothetical protein [Candidatus Microthrix sp.]
MTDAEPPAGRASGGWTLPREAGWLIAGFAALVPAWGLRGAPGPLYEEGFNVVHAELVLGGQTPGVDFHALYGPLGPWLMAGWFKLVGPSIGAQRVIGALLLIAIVLGVRQLLRPWGRNVATVAAVVTSVVVYAQGSLMAVSWWYGYAAVIWGVLLVRSAGPATSPEEGDVRPTPWETVRLVAGGLLFGLALGARVDLALAVAAAGGAALWAHHDRTAFRGVLGRVAAGGAVGLIPLAAYIWLAGPGRAWRVLVVDPVFTLRPYRTLPPPSFFELQGLNRSLRLAPDWPLPAPGLAAQLALWFWISVAAVALLVTVAAILRREQTALVPVAALALATLPQLLQRPDPGHLVLVTAIPLAALPVSCSLAVGLWRRRRAGATGGTAPGSVPARPMGSIGPAWLALTPAIVILLIPALTLGPWLRAVTGEPGRSATDVTVGDRSLLVPTSLGPPIQQVVTELAARAQPGDLMIVTPGDLTRAYNNWTALYTLFPKLTVGTYHSEMDPGFTNVEGSTLPDELARADWVLVSPALPQLREANRSAEAGEPAAQRVFNRRFCPVVETQVLSLWGVCPTEG